MKYLFKSALFVAMCLSMFGCSKKLHSYQFKNTDNSSPTTQLPEEVIYASVENTTPVLTKNNQGFAQLQEARKVTETLKEKPVKRVAKNNLAQRIVAKKIEKELKKGGGISDKMKLGIIIAAISLLVLIIVAAGLLGGISTLFWLLGGLGLLTGLIIILLAALDVI